MSDVPNKEFRIRRNEVALKSQEFQLDKLNKMKENFPKYLNKRAKEFANELTVYLDEHPVPEEDKVPLFDIIQHAFKPLVKASGYTPLYGASEMAIAFEYYVNCTEKLNENGTYVPKIEDFCRLLGISRQRFDDYMNTSSDENMREVCKQVNDYCVGRLADAALAGRVEKTYAIFHQKSSNKQRDNEPIQFNTFTQNNTILTNEEYNELARKYLNPYEEQ